jgi:WhiB family redox-sensing transcriptional regulator
VALDAASAVTAWLMTPGIGEQLPSLEDLCRWPGWQRRAACRGESIETFVPGLGGNFTRARELCARCPVRQECFVTALADPEVVGMWAGTTERKRRKLRAVA